MARVKTAPLWHIQSFEIDTVVQASDQFAAWDTLRDLPLAQFGLIVLANCGDFEPIAIQTSALMRRWDRTADAKACDDKAREQGLI